MKTEDELIDYIKSSEAYKEFMNLLPQKIKRENEAWELILKNKGNYNENVLNMIFDKVDLFEPNKRWFGQLLAKPNRNLIFETTQKELNEWFNELLFTQIKIEDRLTKCIKDKKVRGASKGLATLLLYLMDSDRYNIWVNKTQEGIYLLNRVTNYDGKGEGNYYNNIYNPAVLDFKTKYGFKPQEIDWILTFIAGNVEYDGQEFIVVEENPLTQVNGVDDESGLDDLVGEPMELRVMRWAPTNEMGVVALFIEFRKELDFPIVEIIRTRFPDAVVFEKSSKGFIRRYIEFEFKSSGYKSHLKSNRTCHYVVCWEHNWKECPIPVIELKKEIPKILKKQ